MILEIDNDDGNDTLVIMDITTATTTHYSLLSVKTILY